MPSGDAMGTIAAEIRGVLENLYHGKVLVKGVEVFTQTATE